MSISWRFAHQCATYIATDKTANTAHKMPGIISQETFAESEIKMAAPTPKAKNAVTHVIALTSSLIVEFMPGMLSF